MYYDTLTGWQRIFAKYLLLIVLVVAGLDLTFHYLSKVDRSELHAQQQLIEEQQQQIMAFQAKNREMLDARGRLQISSFNAIMERRAFTQPEIDEMERFWTAAQYDKIQDRFLAPQWHAGK